MGGILKRLVFEGDKASSELEGPPSPIVRQQIEAIRRKGPTLSESDRAKLAELQAVQDVRIPFTVQWNRAAKNASLTIDGQTFELDAPGLRDHSWGPRYWQAPKYYRWLTMSFGDDLGAVPILTVHRDGREMHAGYIYRKGRENEPIVKTEIATDFVGEQQLHDHIQVRATTKSGEVIEITGNVLAMIPLRNRRDGRITRIAEGLTEWRWGDRIGYGLAEYLDHLAE